MNNTKPILILTGGGSASGKSTFCQALTERMKGLRTLTICSDKYFKRGHMPKMTSPLTGIEGDDFNTPEAVDIDGLTAEINEIMSGGSCDVLLVEGVTVLCFEELRNIADLKIFVDLDTNIRMYRRIKRNMAVRGLTLEEVADYFTEYAVFSEAKHSLNTKIYADIIINGASFDKAVDMAAMYIESKAGESQK